MIFHFPLIPARMVFVGNQDSDLAVSTNNDVFIVELPAENGPASQPHKLTTSHANDNNPVFSPDGRYIAYRGMQRPGFEADQYDLYLYDVHTQKTHNLTTEFDS